MSEVHPERARVERFDSFFRALQWSYELWRGAMSRRVDNGRDLVEIASWLRRSTETQRARLMSMITGTFVPDLDEVKAKVEVLKGDINEQ